MNEFPEPSPPSAQRGRHVDRRTVLKAAGLGAVGVLAGGLAAPEGATVADAAAPAPLLQRARWGAYADGEPFPDTMSHRVLEKMVGVRFQRMSWFTTWGMTWPGAGGREAADGGYDVLLAWQPQLAGRAPVDFGDVVAGRYDDYLTRFFTKAAAHPGNVVIRFAHEPNGSGYPWSVGFRGSTGKCVDSTAEYIAGWRYVVNFYRSLSRSWPRRDIRFCWCVTTSDKGGIPFEEYFPGNDYVDILGADVYNGYGGYWSPADNLISKPYGRLTAIGSDQPVWICELGCREPKKVEQAGDPADPTKSKADWLRGLFASTSYPRLESVNFFNANRAHDWRLNSSPEALAVCQQALAGR